MQLNPKEIVIGERQRIDLGDPLNDLASMADPEVGQINDITVEKRDDGRYHLIAGRRRLEFALRSDWPLIGAIDRGNMTELQRQKVEFFEDFDRKERNWQETCIAHRKLYKLQRLEDPSWSFRAMAKFTGLPISRIHYSLKLAEALIATPKDEEIWKAANYVSALQVLIDRRTKEAADRMDVLRAQVASAAKLPTTPQTMETTLTEVFNPHNPTPASIPGIVPEPNKTLELEKVVMYLCGVNMDFNAAKPGVHYMTEHYYASLAFDGEADSEKVMNALRECGIACYWGNEEPFIVGYLMPFTLRWNQINCEGDAIWPFCKNYKECTVLSKKQPTEVCHKLASATISATEDNLAAVVEYTLSAICPENVAVLLPCNAPVVEVAQTGRIPVWFEADPEEFKAQVAALTAYYEETIPNVEVRLRTYEKP